MAYKNPADKAKYMKKYNKEKKSIVNPITLTHYKKLRQGVIDKYGGCCCKCGFGDIRALQIDHVNGGGNKDRKTRSLRQLLFFLKKNKYSKDFQILCANCNSIKRVENKENRYKL